MSYISSNANRFYTALESGYGNLATVSASNRIPAVKLTVSQKLAVTERKDKTGSRTFTGLPVGGQKQTSFALKTYLTNWVSANGSPSYGPLFQAALGASPVSGTPGAVSSVAGATLAFSEPHGLSIGQAVATAIEIRFVTAVTDLNTVQINAPFTNGPQPGADLSTAITYQPATELPSVTLYDYWSPATATQRFLAGAAVDQMAIDVNGDFHEFSFRGIAQDVQDNSSFAPGNYELESYPLEPAVAAFDYSIVPGNLGQAWLGAAPSQFFTVTAASIGLSNDLDARMNEFGSSVPQAIAPGQRRVAATLSLYSQDDSATQALYTAARQQSPISVMFQLGDTQGQMMGVYLSCVVPVVPQFDDSKNRLQWSFQPSRAQGTVDNEIAVAFA
ncbi:MAG: hypothetical protein ABSH56_03095 [Bryobacteraceae bacterium]|jgi:hypothetical protein